MSNSSNITAIMDKKKRDFHSAANSKTLQKLRTYTKKSSNSNNNNNNNKGGDNSINGLNTKTKNKSVRKLMTANMNSEFHA